MPRKKGHSFPQAKMTFKCEEILDLAKQVSVLIAVTPTIMLIFSLDFEIKRCESPG